MGEMGAVSCRMCRESGQTWIGDAPVCSFPGGGEFTSEGWNCATASALRDLSGQGESHPAADHRWFDDQNYSTLLIHEVELPNGHAYALWMTWYKHRGSTDGMWLLSAEQTRKPTEADAVAIIAALARGGRSSR